jgi:hypothetical protein
MSRRAWATARLLTVYLGIHPLWDDGSRPLGSIGCPPWSQAAAAVPPVAGSVAQARTAIADASKTWKGKSPLFLSIGIFAFNMRPTDVAQVAASLGSDYTVVRADQFFDLARQANGLPAAP